MEKETLAGDKEEEKKQDKKGGDRKSKGGGKDQDEKKKKSNGNGNGNGESKIKQMFSEPAPFYITFVVALVKVVFFLYDIVSYIPFQLFANPEQKLRKSERVKAAPVDMDDPSSPWRHVDALDHLEHLVFPKCTTLDQTWREAVVRHGDADALGTREVIKVHKQKQENGRVFEKLEMGEYHWSSYEKVEEVVQAVACGLLDIGHKKTENLVIFADTREEWLETALACFRTGIPVVTVYATLGEEAIAFAINESDATTVVTTHALLDKITAITKDCKSLTRVIYFSNPDPEADEPKIEKTLKDRCQLVISFDDLIERGEDSDQTEFESPKPDDLAVIMYTSGSTGNPKGVMISHKNILAALSGQGAVVTVSESDTVVAYLPLAHILELCVELICLTQGCRVGYSSALTLYDRGSKIQKGTKGDCYALRPTLMACVPAVMDRIFKAVTEEVSQGPAITRELFRVAYERKRARYEDGYNSLVLNTIAFKRIRNLLGGHLRLVLSGGAPLNAETQRFMNICFCCPVIQGYGLTETCGGGTLAEVFDLSTGSVGPPLRCCEIMLREWKDAGYSPKNEVPQGEILISGGNVAMGYYKNEKKTNEDFIKLNGKRWFASGDIGEFRSDGSLRIIDRKKDLLKLAHGEYISLGKVETALLTNPHIDNICVYGDSQHDYLVALVVPNQKKLQELASQNSISDGDFEKLCENSEVNEALLKELQNHAKSKLQKSEMPQKIHICSEPWTTASGLLTEALKLKRKNIENEYKKTLEKLYGGDSKDEKPKKK